MMPRAGRLLSTWYGLWVPKGTPQAAIKASSTKPQ